MGDLIMCDESHRSGSIVNREPDAGDGAGDVCRAALDCSGRSASECGRVQFSDCRRGTERQQVAR